MSNVQPRSEPAVRPSQRADLNDIDAILAVATPDDGSTEHHVNSGGDVLFTWDYGKGTRAALDKLYEKAKTSQWNASTDLPWHLEVDPEALVSNPIARERTRHTMDIAASDGLPMARWGEAEWLEFQMESQNWTLSQFLHGEQGALLCTAKIVETVPWIDAKYYAATQVVDEARHVEVFSRYLDEKLTGHYPINAHLAALLEDIVADSRWDMTYLGMQIMVEGLALAAFGFLHMLTEEPLLRALLKAVMADEARHVAFGVLSLREVYEQLSDTEMKERQEFAFDAAIRMRDRFLSQEVYERMGVDVRTMMHLHTLHDDKDRDPFQQMLFAKIVPNCAKLGLLDRNDGWLRERFGRLGVLQFEHADDVATEVLGAS
jgi:hypothetical protein